MIRRPGMVLALATDRVDATEQSAELLVVAGEASGDAMAAPVVRRLGVPAFGLGGSALGGAGVELTGHLSKLTAMGVGAVMARGPELIGAALKLLIVASRRRPRVALLVGFSELNGWLGPRLRRLGTRVLWYGAPQVWAWRPGRADTLRRACDRMAVVLPFEEQLWRRHGVDAHYVGHPALERVAGERDRLRVQLGMTPYADYVAVLPGSRPHEVRHHLGPMLAAVNLLRRERGALDARVVVAPSLAGRVAAWIAENAMRAGVATLHSDAASVLAAFDVALAASGTVTLECTVAEVPPVVAYRVGPVSAFIAARTLRVENVALPNLLLGEQAFPELLQEAMTAEALAEEAERLLEQRAAFVARCRDVRRVLETGSAASERVARLMERWLD